VISGTRLVAIAGRRSPAKVTNATPQARGAATEERPARRRRFFTPRRFLPETRNEAKRAKLLNEGKGKHIAVDTKPTVECRDAIDLLQSSALDTKEGNASRAPTTRIVGSHHSGRRQ
jgi:hypothetical protein